MATSKRGRRSPGSDRNKSRVVPDAEVGIPILPPADVVAGEFGVETTGRVVVILKDEAVADKAAALSTLRQAAGIRDVVGTSDFEGGAISAEAMAENKVIHFEALGVMIVPEDRAVEALTAAASDADSPILAVEPEYVAYPSTAPDVGLGLDYLRGYRDAVDHVYDQLVGRETAEVEVEIAERAAAFHDTAQFTWGLQATRVSTSRFTGQGIKVAVLDTGIDVNHPDFRGRAIVGQTFSGFPVQDIHGHGTHCIGTACGPQRPASGVRRYGCAPAAQIFAGKVFDNSPRPRAATRSVLDGIEWAIANGCRVVSLSLGVPLNAKVMQYEVPIRRALNAGTLVVAAAGNNADRPGNLGFVEPPANADAALSVAALDNRLQIARFSARSSQVTGLGGSVNVAAPGVAVFSSVPVARGTHAAFNGTSMATPHVAGIAALWSQATGETGSALWSRVIQSARPLRLPSLDVGAGLVQAPQ